jgi:branched-chain amino acid transport system substrate-binding protein
MSTRTARLPRAARRLAIPGSATLALVLVLLAINWWRQQSATAVAIGIDMPLTAGGAIDPSDKTTADLYLEDNPNSRISIRHFYNSADPARAPGELRQAMRDGIQFFINTQASNNAVQCLNLFRSQQALTINVSATSTRLSNQDDHFLRIIPDLQVEQNVIAAQVNKLPGRRLLILQDNGNLTYTDPALASFRKQLDRRWQPQIRQLRFTTYQPQEIESLVQQPFDALYILGGGFLPSIGNMAQQFHRHHPHATIVLTPWSRSSMIEANAGNAAGRILQISPYSTTKEDPALRRYMRRFLQRFGYEPYAMSIGTRQALELLDQAFRQGHRTPVEVKRYLLSKPSHRTSLGTIRFDRYGDSRGGLKVYRLNSSSSSLTP